MEELRDYLITDRTAADVERVRYLRSLWGPRAGQWRGTQEELAEWNAGLRGAYNAGDLNRVARAADYLLTELGKAGYRIPADTYPAYLAAVTVDPPGSGTAQGTLFYEGENAAVKAETIGKSIFKHWTENGEIVSESPVYTFVASGNKSLTAHFEAEWVMESSIVGAGRIGKAILGRGL